MSNWNFRWDPKSILRPLPERCVWLGHISCWLLCLVLLGKTNILFLGTLFTADMLGFCTAWLWFATSNLTILHKHWSHRSQPCFFHHMSHFSTGFMAAPLGQPHASEKPLLLARGPTTRNLSGACSSRMMWFLSVCRGTNCHSLCFKWGLDKGCVMPRYRSHNHNSSGHLVAWNSP